MTDDGTVLLVNVARRTVEPLSDGVDTDDIAWTTDADRLAIYRNDRRS